MKYKNKLLLLVLLIFSILLVGCRFKMGDTVIKCNQLTGKCTIKGGDKNLIDCDDNNGGCVLKDDDNDLDSDIEETSKS